MKILHFADTHIDAVQSGKWDPQTGLPIRAMDFLRSLDTIVDTAIEEKVDLVLFAGDAYKDRNPTPVYQDAFASRILKLENAQIPTFLLVGNHDMGALSKAHALTEFKTFNTDYVQVLDEIKFTKRNDFDLISLPWVHKSQLITEKVIQQLEAFIKRMDPETPNIFLGHCSVVGARFSSERLIMLGEDLMLPLKLLTESGFDYVALGHIHKAQELNKNENGDVLEPPVVYPGSIERVDWGEAGENKGFVIAHISENNPVVIEQHILETRSMLDFNIEVTNKDGINHEILQKMGDLDTYKESMIRIKLQYPEHWAGLINNQSIEQMFPEAFSVQIIHEPIRESRTRLDLDKEIAAYTPEELLQMWMEQKGVKKTEQDELLTLAIGLFGGADDQQEIGRPT